MDDLIEYRTKKSIPEIFEDDGEDAFRKIETDILRELSEKSSRVVSTGGGVPVRELNRQIMRNSGVIIHLTATPETIHKRLTTRQSRNRTLASACWAMTPQSNGLPICWLSEPRHIRAPTDPSTPKDCRTAKSPPLLKTSGKSCHLGRNPSQVNSDV